MLDYTQQDEEPCVLWVQEYKGEDQHIFKLSNTFKEMLEALVDPSDKFVFGFLNFHSNQTRPLLEYLSERFELFFRKQGNEFHSSHFYWKNTGRNTIQFVYIA